MPSLSGKISRHRLSVLSLAAALCASCLAGRAGATGLPNVLTVLDTSGSMGDTVQALADYVHTSTYTCTPSNHYTTAKVYLYDYGTYTEYSASIAAVSSAPARTGLTNLGFWFGNLAGSDLKLFHGNYLNYRECAPLVARTKLAIAKSVINTVVSSIPQKRFGVMRLNPSAAGGVIVSPIGTATTTIVAQISTQNASGNTPLGPALRDAGLYYKGQFSYPSPIQDGCQQNSVFLISDGAETQGPPWLIPQASAEYAADHSATYNGIQNLVINTVSFYLNPGTDAAAISSMTNAAYYGGGVYVSANDPAQLTEAFFQIPPGVSLVSPSNNAIVSGSISLYAGVGNLGCVSSLQFKVDGNDKCAPMTAAPFQCSWNSNEVVNGTHSVTAVLTDANGAALASYPSIITTSNDQTAPAINSINWTTWQTSVTVTWQTSEPADTQVDFGTSTSYGQTTSLNPALVTSHTLTLTGLLPGTAYHSQLKSRDAAGNLTVLGDSPFTTQAIAQVGPLDHLRLNFGNAQLPGPGTKAGNYPYTLTAGECYGVVIEAVDIGNNHVNISTAVSIGLYALNDSGVVTSLVPGISLRDNYQLGVQTMSFNMVNGLIYLGTESDITKQLCFYRATAAPAPNYLGGLQLKTQLVSSPTVQGISSNFTVLPSAAAKLLLTGPGQTQAPATDTGLTGTPGQPKQGNPFLVRAALTDLYYNTVQTGVDNLRFSSSLYARTGFSPFEQMVTDGVLLSSVTVDTCTVPVTLTVQDLTFPSVTSAQLTLTMQACAAPAPGDLGFFQLSAPGLARAGDPFNLTIDVKNVHTVSSVRYAGTLAPLVPVDLTRFTYADGALGTQAFEFNIPSGTVGSYTYTLANQTYNRSGTVWLQLTGTAPAELAEATSLAGPVLFLPGNPNKITASASPPRIGPLSSAQITVKLADIYGNGVPNIAVSAQVTDGTGRLNLGGVQSALATANTNASGETTLPFVSQQVSENDTVRIWAPSYPLVPAVDLTIPITLIGDRTIAAYPSPAKITERPVTIEYRLDNDSEVELVIVTSMGREVWRRKFPPAGPGGAAGFNTVHWDGRNGAGEMVASGVYGLHLKAKAFGQTTEYKTRIGILK